MQQRQRLWTKSRNAHQLDQAWRNPSALLLVALDLARAEVLFDHFGQVFTDTGDFFEVSSLSDRGQVFFQIPD